jgi:hypothetical protein
MGWGNGHRRLQHRHAHRVVFADDAPFSSSPACRPSTQSRPGSSTRRARPRHTAPSRSLGAPWSCSNCRPPSGCLQSPRWRSAGPSRSASTCPPPSTKRTDSARPTARPALQNSSCSAYSLPSRRVPGRPIPSHPGARLVPSRRPLRRRSFRCSSPTWCQSDRVRDDGGDTRCAGRRHLRATGASHLGRPGGRRRWDRRRRGRRVRVRVAARDGSRRRQHRFVRLRLRARRRPGSLDLAEIVLDPSERSPRRARCRVPAQV